MKLAFLLYFSRSGSSLLADRIAAHLENVVVFPELDLVGLLFMKGGAYFRRQSSRSLLRLLRLDSKLNDVSLTDDDLRCAIKECAGKDIRCLLIEIALRYSQALSLPTPEVALFQRGTLLSCSRQIANSVPDARFIHIYRDPRAAISSIIGIRSRRFDAYPASRMGRNDVLGLSRNWAAYMNRVSALKADYPNLVREIRYEDFCHDIAGTLVGIGGFLGVGYSKTGTGARLQVASEEREIHTNLGRPPLLERLDSWRNELSVWRGYIIEQQSRREMYRRGYEPYFSPNLHRHRRGFYKVKSWLDYVRETIARVLRVCTRFVRSPTREIADIQAKLTHLARRGKARSAGSRSSAP